MSVADVSPLRLGIAGLGTVGIGVVKIVQAHADLLAARAGRPVVITAVSARDRSKNRDADLSAYAWETDPVALATREDVDVLVELIGGHEGAARSAIEAALSAGKDVVTANKALLAHHGQALAEMAAEVTVHERFLDSCIASLMRDELDTATASIAKLSCTELQDRVADGCLQLFGGYGYMREYPISRFYADSRVQRIYGGASEVMKELISRDVLK